MRQPLPLRRGPRLPSNTPARINWSHPLARGLIGCYLPGISRGIALVGPNLSDGDGGAGTRSITRDGLSLKSTTSGSNKGLTAAAPANFTSWTGFSIFWRGVVFGAADGFAPIIAVTYDNADTSPYILLGLQGSSANTNIEAFYNSAGLGGNTAPGIDVSGNYGTPISLAATALVGGNAISYYNGASVGSNTFGASGPNKGTAPQVTINQYVPSNNRTPNADCNAGYFWNRDLSAAEVQLLDADPYCFLIFAQDEMMARRVGAAAAAFLAKNNVILQAVTRGSYI